MNSFGFRTNNNSAFGGGGYGGGTFGQQSQVNQEVLNASENGVNPGTYNINWTPGRRNVLHQEANDAWNNHKFTSITVCPELKDRWSLVELRLVDYYRGLATSSAQPTSALPTPLFANIPAPPGPIQLPKVATGGFGGTSTQFGGGGSTFGGGGGQNKFFGGQQQNTSTFGANNTIGGGGGFGSTTGGFGSTTGGTGIFGSTATNTSPGLFGTSTQPNSNQTGGLFGNTNTGGFNKPNTTGFFGANTSNNMAGGFGQTNAVGGFGSTQPQQNTGGGLFGQTTSGFGSPNTGNTGGGLFGTSTQNTLGQTQNTGFGMNNTTNTTTGGLFGNTSTTGTGGLFGQNANKPTTTGGLFGGTSNTGGLFGNTNTTTTTGAGGGLFGSNATNTTTGGGGLFGNTSNTLNKPATTGGLFGNTATTTGTGGGLFGSNATNTTTGGGGLFGGMAAKPATGGLFGNTTATQGTSLFGNPTGNALNTTSTTSLFGNTTMATTGTTGGLFGSPTGARSTSLFSAQPAQQPSNIGQPESNSYVSSAVGLLLKDSQPQYIAETFERLLNHKSLEGMKPSATDERLPPCYEQWIRSTPVTQNAALDPAKPYLNESLSYGSKRLQVYLSSRVRQTEPAEANRYLLSPHTCTMPKTAPSSPSQMQVAHTRPSLMSKPREFDSVRDR